MQGLQKGALQCKSDFFLLQIIELSDYDSPATRKPRFLLEPRTVRKKREKVEWILERESESVHQWIPGSEYCKVHQKICDKWPEAPWSLLRKFSEDSETIFKRLNCETVLNELARKKNQHETAVEVVAGKSGVEAS